jgi:hypothetical protein
LVRGWIEVACFALKIQCVDIAPSGF